MKKRVVGALIAALPMCSLAAEWKNVPLVDRTCADTARVQPDDHPRECLLLCAASGYGILDGGTWIALDDAGDEMALDALRATRQEDHIRVDVTGEQVGPVIHVTSLTLSE